jgi:hypothetical protein
VLCGSISTGQVAKSPSTTVVSHRQRPGQSIVPTAARSPSIPFRRFSHFFVCAFARSIAPTKTKKVRSRQNDHPVRTTPRARAAPLDCVPHRRNHRYISIGSGTGHLHAAVPLPGVARLHSTQRECTEYIAPALYPCAARAHGHSVTNCHFFITLQRRSDSNVYN